MNDQTAKHASLLHQIMNYGKKKFYKNWATERHIHVTLNDN